MTTSINYATESGRQAQLTVQDPSFGRSTNHEEEEWDISQAPSK